MGDPFNLNINDAYVAAMTGVPVRPSLASAFSAPYADLSSHDSYEHGEHGGHGGHGEGHKASHRRKLILALSAITVIGGAILLGKFGKVPPPETTRASILNPRTWGWARWNRATPRYGVGDTAGVAPGSPAHHVTPPDPHPQTFMQRTGQRISGGLNRFAHAARSGFRSTP